MYNRIAAVAHVYRHSVPTSLRHTCLIITMCKDTLPPVTLFIGRPDCSAQKKCYQNQIQPPTAMKCPHVMRRLVHSSQPCVQEQCVHTALCGALRQTETIGSLNSSASSREHGKVIDGASCGIGNSHNQLLAIC